MSEGKDCHSRLINKMCKVWVFKRRYVDRIHLTMQSSDWSEFVWAMTSAYLIYLLYLWYVRNEVCPVSDGLKRAQRSNENCTFDRKNMIYRGEVDTWDMY